MHDFSTADFYENPSELLIACSIVVCSPSQYITHPVQQPCTQLPARFLFPSAGDLRYKKKPWLASGTEAI